MANHQISHVVAPWQALGEWEGGGSMDGKGQYCVIKGPEEKKAKTAESKEKLILGT